MQELQQLLDTILDRAQAIRIQQVQATYADETWSPELLSSGDRAWAELNRAHEQLSAILGVHPYDRLFRRHGDKNPWGYPDHLGRCIIWCLAYLWGINVVGHMGNSIIVRAPFEQKYAYWFIADNGGELTVEKINDPVTAQLPGIACTGGHFIGFHKRPMAWALQVAQWISHRILEREGGVDYSIRVTAEDEDVLRVLEQRSGTTRTEQ